MTEYEDAIRLANHILDRPSGDPDDDLAVLSRQFLRALERVERIRAEAEAAILLAAADRCEAWAIKNYMDDFGSFVARNVAVNLRDEIKALQSSDAAAALARRDAETRREAAKARDAAYAERDKLVCALSKLFPSSLERHPDTDTTWENDWRWIVFIDLPSGQATWHIHDSELGMFDHLPRFTGRKWDGHTTPEKYERLAALTRQLDEAKAPKDVTRE